MSSSPPVTQQQAEAVAEKAIDGIRTLLHTSKKCCLTCDHWKKDREICGKWNQKPPLQVICYGCPDYVNTPF